MKTLKYRFWYMPADPAGERMTVAFHAKSEHEARLQLQKQCGWRIRPGTQVEVKCEGAVIG